jgi:hypothetical protein
LVASLDIDAIKTWIDAIFTIGAIFCCVLN